MKTKLFIFLSWITFINCYSQVTPIIPSGDSVGSLIEFKNRQYLFVFGAYPAIIVTDGTSNPIKNVQSLPNGSTVASANKTSSNLFLVVSSTSGTTNDLYITDGTNETLTKILSLNQQYIGLSPSIKLANNQYDKKTPQNIIGNKIIFGVVSSDNTVSTIWVSDATSTGTFKLTSSTGDQLDVLKDSFGNNIGGYVYFNAKVLNSTDAYYLWKTDGTIAGTTPVFTSLGEKLFTPTKSTLESLNDELLFVATTTNSNSTIGDLYKTNGTPSGTVKLFTKPQQDWFINYNTDSSSKSIGRKFKNKFYFFANDGTLGDYYLYETDGTVTGTKLVKNTGDNNINIRVPNVPVLFIEDDNYLYFSGKGRKWFSPTFSFAWDFYFATDGTTTKTIDEASNYPAISSLWHTPEGIIGNIGINSFRFDGWNKPVKTTYTSSEINLQGSVFIHKNKIFFPAAEGISNNELWVSDGTQLGTKKFAEIAPGSLNSDVKYFFEINNVLYFMARQGNAAPFYLYKLGEDYTFNGSISNSLSNPQNWNSGSLPTSVDNATIPSGFNIGLESAFVSKNLTANSPIFITSGSLNIAGNLNLGATITLNNNSLNLKGNTSLISNGNSTNYIVTNGTGTVNVENLNSARGSVSLPIGTATNYNPISIANSGTSDTFSARVTEGNSSTNPSINATWEISEAISGGSNVNLTLGWNQSQENSGFDRNSAKIGHFVGGTWVQENSGTVSGVNPYTLSATGISTFSPFSVMNFSALGTQDFSKSKISIYPNPFNEILNISAQENGVVYFYDGSGKLVSSSVLLKGNNSLNKSTLQKGVYIYQMKNKNGEIISSGKVIKK